MFDFLNYLGNKVVGRYKTVESNIRNRSNSFYDSFLDLLEDTVKTILMKEDIGYDGRTCGEILKEPDTNNFFKHKAKVDNDVYAKVVDYIKKINEHKHKTEKYVNVDMVVIYMNTYYSFIVPYMEYKGVETSPFNENYFRSIYGITLERSKELDNVSQKVDEYVETTNVKIDEMDKRVEMLEAWTLAFNQREKQQPKNPQPQTQQAQNKPTEKDAMNWFFRTSKKSWRWFGNEGQLRKDKGLAIFSHILLLVIGFITTIITSVSIGFYPTFTLFENVWLVFGIVLLVYASKSKIKYESGALAKNSSFKYKQDQYGLWNPGKEKVVFKIFRWIAGISIVCNIIFIWFRQSNFSLLATILEVLLLGALIFSHIMNAFLFSQYTIIYLEGRNMQNTQNVVLVWDPMIKKLIPEEEYRKKMPFLFMEY